MEDNLWISAVMDFKYKTWANSEDRFQLIVSKGTGLGDLILGLKKAEDTCVYSRIHFLCAQHVSDINIFIIRSLRLCC